MSPKKKLSWSKQHSTQVRMDLTRLLAQFYDQETGAARTACVSVDLWAVRATTLRSTFQDCAGPLSEQRILPTGATKVSDLLCVRGPSRLQQTGAVLWIVPYVRGLLSLIYQRALLSVFQKLCASKHATADHTWTPGVKCTDQ